MAEQSKDALERAKATFKKKEAQAREGALAKAEYEAAILAERAKTARLKLLRETKQTADAASAEQRKTAEDTAGKRTGRIK